MDEFVRSVKFLYTINKGIIILDKKWILDCIKNQNIISVEEYTYKCPNEEKIFNFNLQKSLELAREN